MRSRSVGSGRNLRPSWIEIDRGAIQDNVRTIKSRLGSDVAMFCTLKSNACGFDLEQAGLLLEAESAAHGISLVDMGDAITLRERGVTKPILLFGGNLLDADKLAFAEKHRFILTAHDAISLAAILMTDRSIEFVVEFNVGAERLGFPPAEAAAVIAQIRISPSARLVGVTAHMHLSKADNGLSAAREQYDRFLDVVARFTAAGLDLRYKLIASSGTLLLTNEMNLTAVDPGHLVFGMVPPEQRARSGLRSALRAIKSRLIQVSSIAYADGRNSPFAARVGMRTGIVPFGASDGMARITCGYVLVGGKSAPILTINAEHTEVDLTGVPEARVGDEVVVVGSQDGSEITIADVEAKHPDMRSVADAARNVSPFIRRVYVD